ncbi:MAG: hypothetical protein BWY72_01813 [Bacteroidetes bacterium ADurb.Bin416]|nr:MAG: hypothetical protein BWY72_01813 [Bacteroidetes bacterium ADurb.Bin416]
MIASDTLNFKPLHRLRTPKFHQAIFQFHQVGLLPFDDFKIGVYHHTGEQVE